MKPVPRDNNGHPLLDRGTEFFTHRIEDLGTDMSGVSLPVDCKEVMFHVELGSEIIRVSGTIAGSNTARLTSSGHTWTLPITSESGHPLAYLAAPSGTCSVSIFAWR
jgi:hypothetical protein